MKKLLLLVLIALMVVPAYSQDAEPTLTAQDLYNWSYTLYFPQQIEFTLFAKRSESAINTLRLTIDYDGVDPITLPLETVIAIPTSNGTIYAYTWLIPEDTPPPLFSTIRYRWDVTTTEGQQVVATGDITFEDTRLPWVRNDDIESRVDMYYAQNQVDADDLRSGIRATYDLLFANSDTKKTYKLLIYPASVPAGCAVNDEGDPVITIGSGDESEEVECNLELAYRIFEQGNFILFNQSGVASIQQSLIELFVEIYYTDIWGNTDVPAWFLRGLQRFYDPRPDLEALSLAQQRQRSGDLLSLDELATAPDNDDLYAIWDAQSIGLVMYIADTIGVDGLFEFASNLGDADSFADAYESATGDNFDLLLLSWGNWLFRSSSRDDYEYNPYLPDTATPTVTPTATNTPTATFTPSKTPDVTSTLRPTFTRIPPTATITPLPAQSFSVQPTDAPRPIQDVEQPQSPPSNSDQTTRLAIGGAIITVLLIILFFVLRQR